MLQLPLPVARRWSVFVLAAANRARVRVRFQIRGLRGVFCVLECIDLNFSDEKAV